MDGWRRSRLALWSDQWEVVVMLLTRAMPRRRRRRTWRIFRVRGRARCCRRWITDESRREWRWWRWLVGGAESIRSGGGDAGNSRSVVVVSSSQSSSPSQRRVPSATRFHFPSVHSDLTPPTRSSPSLSLVARRNIHDEDEGEDGCRVHETTTHGGTEVRSTRSAHGGRGNMLPRKPGGR